MVATNETTSLLGHFSHKKLRTGTLRRSCGAPTSGRSCDFESRLVHSLHIMVENFYGGASTSQQARGVWRREYYYSQLFPSTLHTLQVSLQCNPSPIVSLRTFIFLLTGFTWTVVLGLVYKFKLLV